MEGLQTSEHILAIVLCCCAAAVPLQAQTRRLPAEIRADLTWHAGQWRFVGNLDSYGKRCTDVRTADLDGDGGRDYAVYILVGNGPSEQRQRLIVYLRTGAGYTRRTLARGAANEIFCLHLFKAGEQDYNYETQKNFRYKLATVGVFSEKGGSSYVYWRGRFYRITTSD
jgi:hypothetical protein